MSAASIRPPHGTARVRSIAARAIVALAAAVPLLLFDGAGTPARGEARAGETDKPAMIANPIEQRQEMIALLRSIDSHLKSIEDSLAAKQK